MFIKTKWISISSLEGGTSAHVRYILQIERQKKSLFVRLLQERGIWKVGLLRLILQASDGDGGTVFFFLPQPNQGGAELLSSSSSPPAPWLQRSQTVVAPTFKLFLSVWLPSASFCRPSGEVRFLCYKIFYLFLQQGPALCFFALWLVLCFLFWVRGPQGITVKPRDVWNGSVWQWIYVVLFSHVTCIRSILLLYVVTISEFLLSLIIFLNILNSLWTADLFRVATAMRTPDGNKPSKMNKLRSLRYRLLNQTIS